MILGNSQKFFRQNCSFKAVARNRTRGMWTLRFGTVEEELLWPTAGRADSRIGIPADSRLSNLEVPYKPLVWTNTSLEGNLSTEDIFQVADDAVGTSTQEPARAQRNNPCNDALRLFHRRLHTAEE